MCKILVTGGAGFIGSHVVDALIEQGHSVAVVDNLSTGFEYNLHAEAKFYKVDVAAKDLAGIFAVEQPEYVFHLAAQIDVQTSVHNPLEDARVNILGTINLLECCRKYGVKKVIYSSSAAVYGEPEYLGIDEKHPLNALSPYGITKHTPEHYLFAYRQLYGVDFTVLRYSNVYGPRQDAKGEGGVIAIFTDRMLAGKIPVIFGTGEQTRDFIYVADVASANLKAMERGAGEIVNISTNSQISVRELVEVMNRVGGYDYVPEHKPARPGDILHSYLDNSVAKKVLDWEPVHSLADGLGITFNYYREIAAQ